MLALLIAYAAGRSDRRRGARPTSVERAVCWLIVCALITAATVPVGLVLLVPTVLVLAAQAVAQKARIDGPPA